MTGNCELRFGNTAALLFAAMGEKPMKQLDLLDLFFPCLFVEETEAAGNSRDAEFDDQNMVIRAVRKNNSLHVGSGRRVSQILGRLCGTAKGNQEKERRTALLLQKKAAEVICTDREYMLVLQDNIREIINVLNDESREAFVILLGIFLTELSYREKEECDPDILFPLDPEVFEGIVYHAIKQFKSGDWEGIRNAWLWILIGSLLRNESGRVLRFYDSSFIMVNRMPSEEETFEDRLNFLLHPAGSEFAFIGHFTTRANIIRNILYLLLYVLLKPVCDEYIFRGIIQRQLGHYSRFFGVLASSLLYAIAQPSLSDAIPAFFLGWYLALVTLRYHSIRPAVTIHVLVSVFLWIVAIIPPEYSLIPIIVITLNYIVTLLFIIGNTVNYRIAFMRFPEKKLWKTVFTSSTIIICILLFAAENILSFF